MTISLTMTTALALVCLIGAVSTAAAQDIRPHKHATTHHVKKQTSLTRANTPALSAPYNAGIDRASQCSGL
jgi:hypothetical protein